MKHTISPDRTRLTITIDDAERQELREMQDGGARLEEDSELHNFFEPLTCNSELQWIPEGNTGGLTTAPMLGICGEDQDAPESYSTDKSHTGFLFVGCNRGKFIVMPIVERWAFMDYQVRSVLEDLRDKGECVFVGGPLEVKPKPQMSSEDFSTYLHAIVGKMSAGQILSYGNVYTELAEELNNEVIEAWEKDQKK